MPWGLKQPDHRQLAAVMNLRPLFAALNYCKAPEGSPDGLEASALLWLLQPDYRLGYTYIHVLHNSLSVRFVELNLAASIVADLYLTTAIGSSQRRREPMQGVVITQF